MSRDLGFAEYIVEDVLGHMEGITFKVLFSGYGVYLEGVIVGIIIDGIFYTKTNKELMIKYEKEGCEPFKYKRNDKKVVVMPYVSVPIEILEDREKISDRIYESFELVNKKDA